MFSSDSYAELDTFGALRKKSSLDFFASFLGQAKNEEVYFVKCLALREEI
jgi:hypothetical protein